VDTVTVWLRRSEDLPECVALLESTRGIDMYPVLWPKDPARWLGPPKELAAWVARDTASGIVGCVSVQPVGNDPARDVWSNALGAADERMMVVSRLIVSPLHRRNGVGEKLVTVAARYAHERDAHPVLDVADHNVDAIRLYDRLGWRRVGELEIDLGRPITFIAYVGPAPGF
jgi:ribosomal protein S18 acetylase RimI-like enzyme